MTESPAGYCTGCGTPLHVGSRFCARCGKAVGSAGGSRMHGHVQLLGILLLAWGIVSFALHLLGVLAAGTVGIFLSKLLGLSLSESAVLPSVIAAVAVIYSLVSLLAIGAGVELLQYRDWGRMLGLVACMLALVRPPFGTLLGIYGLWVLLSQEGEQHYGQEAARRATV